MTQDENKTPDEEKENAPASVTENEKQSESSEGEEQLTLYKRPKRNGKYLQRLESKELETLQKRKSLFMYLSTLMFAISLFIKVEGRARLAANTQLKALFTLYVICELVLVVSSVYVSVMNRSYHKIGPELKEKNVPAGGLDNHTFWSYEIFNALHFVLAAAEIVSSVYGFSGADAVKITASVANILVSAASAVFALMSRQILFKANAENLEYIPGRDDDLVDKKEKKKKRGS